MASNTQVMENRFSPLDSNGDDNTIFPLNSEWEKVTQQRKRPKISSSNDSQVDIGQFKNLSLDDKLSVLYEDTLKTK